MDDTLPAETRELLLLWAARETGALDALAASAGTPAALADETGLTVDAAEAFVAALAERGFLDRVGDEYEPTNRMLGFLTKTDVRSVGGLPAALDAVDAWTRLPETATGHERDSPAHATRNALGAQWAAEDATVRATVTAAVRAAPDADSVVVLRDGPGRHAREFAARGLDATVVETPDRGAAVEPLLRASEVRLETGGYLDSIPQSDLAVAVDLTRRHTPEQNQRWMRAAAESTEAVVAVEPLRDRTPDADLLAVETLATGGAGVYDAATVRGWLEEVGFESSVDPVPGTDRAAVVGHGVQ
ncbi:hypothetical protein [Halorarius halobius]|uniref:hypothetical protein n=1 Tax=Halorarius halobius TaxID=2962671 RepID=UPI0020CC4FC8|nr:hypothetical protein [Halorarius halobius]